MPAFKDVPLPPFKLKAVTTEKQKRPTPTRKRIVELRRELMAEAVKYAKAGPVETRPTRVREASDLSGIPIVLIEAEM